MPTARQVTRLKDGVYLVLAFISISMVIMSVGAFKGESEISAATMGTRVKGLEETHRSDMAEMRSSINEATNRINTLTTDSAVISSHLEQQTKILEKLDHKVDRVLRRQVR